LKNISIYGASEYSKWHPCWKTLVKDGKCEDYFTICKSGRNRRYKMEPAGSIMPKASENSTSLGKSITTFLKN